MNMRVAAPLAALVFLFAGAMSAPAETKKAKILDSSVSEDVKIFYEGKPNRPYRSVGKLKIKKTGKHGLPKSKRTIEEEARERTAAMGGDAVIKWNSGPLYVDAVAVKYVKSE